MFWTESTLSFLIKSIKKQIQRYENKLWPWQQNHVVISKLKNLLASATDKTLLNDNQLWPVFELLRDYTTDHSDPNANDAIAEIKKTFPCFDRLRHLKVEHFKDYLTKIIAHHQCRQIIDVLEKLDQLNLLANDSIRMFAMTESKICLNIIEIFTNLDEQLFLELIKLHEYGGYLFETELHTLATHPHKEELFTALALFHTHHSLPRDRCIWSNLIAHDEASDITCIIKLLQEYKMINKPLLDFCGTISKNQHALLVYALQSMHERTTTADETYFLNIKKIFAALLSLDIFTRENIDCALKYAHEDKLANAFHHLNEFAMSLKTAYTPLAFTRPQFYFDAIAAHPYPEEIAYCLHRWRDGRTIEGLDTCLSVTNLHMIRLLTRFIDSSTLRPNILDSLMQLGHIYADQDLQEIVDAFVSLYNYMLAKEIWQDQGEHFMQVCKIALENPSEGKEKLLEYIRSIKDKDHLERERRVTMLFSGSKTGSVSTQSAPSFRPSNTG